MIPDVIIGKIEELHWGHKLLLKEQAPWPAVDDQWKVNSVATLEVSCLIMPLSQFFPFYIFYYNICIFFSLFNLQVLCICIMDSSLVFL